MCSVALIPSPPPNELKRAGHAVFYRYASRFVEIVGACPLGSGRNNRGGRLNSESVQRVHLVEAQRKGARARRRPPTFLGATQQVHRAGGSRLPWLIPSHRYMWGACDYARRPLPPRARARSSGAWTLGTPFPTSRNTSWAVRFA